jgi:hypothetical protein
MKPGGGPLPLARPDLLPDEFAAMKAQIEFIRRHHPIKRIVLFSHQFCKRYTEFFNRETCAPDIERADLLVAVRRLKEMYPDLEILGFFGRFTPNRKRVYFEDVSQEAFAQETVAA